MNRTAGDHHRGDDGSWTASWGCRTPTGRVPWPLWRDGGCSAVGHLPAGRICSPPRSAPHRLGLRHRVVPGSPDGTFWFGDEFGPFLLHTDVTGRLLRAGSQPGCLAANPTLAAGEPPTSRQPEGSRGSHRARRRPLGPMLEGARRHDEAAGLRSDLRIYEVQTGHGGGARFTGTSGAIGWSTPDSIGDFVAVNDHQFLVIERDGRAIPRPGSRLSSWWTSGLRMRRRVCRQGPPGQPDGSPDPGVRRAGRASSLPVRDHRGCRDCGLAHHRCAERQQLPGRRAGA